MGPGPQTMRQLVPHVSSSTHPQNMGKLMKQKKYFSLSSLSKSIKKNFFSKLKQNQK